jgi:hypothetical protein
MTPEDLAALRRAVRSLEHPGLAASLTNMVGKPIELIGNALPASARQAIATATSKALQAALKVALRTMPRTDHAGSGLLHKALATASGAAGGAFGLATLPVELPVSTIIMLRSIAEIARSHGEDPSDPESALSCIQVFALGGRAGSADASETGYFAVRGMLAKSVTEAARFIAERGIIEEGAPVLVRLSTIRVPHNESQMIHPTQQLSGSALSPRAGQKTTNKYRDLVMVPIVNGPDQCRTYTIARLHNCSRRYIPPLAL